MRRNEMRRSGLVILAFTMLVLGQHCGEVNIIEPRTQDEQLAIDLEIIEAYRVKNELVFETDSSVYPVQYAILEEGNGGVINFEDIVFYHYILQLTDSTVFATSIDTVAENNDIYSENFIYRPQPFSYTQTGWAIPDIIVNSQQNPSHEQGWKRGITAALSKMNVGGHVLIAVPSGLAYASTTPFGIPFNSPVIFEAYITNAK